MGDLLQVSKAADRAVLPPGHLWGNAVLLKLGAQLMEAQGVLQRFPKGLGSLMKLRSCGTAPS